MRWKMGVPNTKATSRSWIIFQYLAQLSVFHQMILGFKKRKYFNQDKNQVYENFFVSSGFLHIRYISIAMTKKKIIISRQNIADVV